MGKWPRMPCQWEWEREHLSGGWFGAWAWTLEPVVTLGTRPSKGLAGVGRHGQRMFSAALLTVSNRTVTTSVGHLENEILCKEKVVVED